MRDVVPTDADRDAAARLYLMLQGAPSSPHDESEAEAIRRGEWDQQDIVQALAQHALSARPSPARDDFEIDTPLSKPLVVVRTQARQLDAARDEVLEALRQKLWMIACHATGGGIPEIEGIDRPTNDICVQITAHVNRIYAAGKEAALKSHPPSTVGEDATAGEFVMVPREQLREWYSEAVGLFCAAATDDDQRATPRIMRELEAMIAAPKPTQPSIPIGQREDLVQQIKRIVGCIAHDADRGTVEVFKLIDSLAALSATPVDVGEGKPPA